MDYVFIQNPLFLEPIDIIYVQKEQKNMNHTSMSTYKQEVGQTVPSLRH